jgi:hypothetical protein
LIFGSITEDMERIGGVYSLPESVEIHVSAKNGVVLGQGDQDAQAGALAGMVVIDHFVIAAAERAEVRAIEQDQAPLRERLFQC